MQTLQPIFTKNEYLREGFVNLYPSYDGKTCCPGTFCRPTREQSIDDAEFADRNPFARVRIIPKVQA